MKGNAPDVVGPVVAWRLMRVTLGGRLVSPLQKYVWQPGWNTAQCPQWRHSRLREFQFCMCGFYCLKDPYDAIREGVRSAHPETSLVLTSILVKGAYVQHAAGWRVTKAQVRSIHMRSGFRGRVLRAARRYNVPVQVGKIADDTGRKLFAWVVARNSEGTGPAQLLLPPSEARPWRRVTFWREDPMFPTKSRFGYPLDFTAN